MNSCQINGKCEDKEKCKCKHIKRLTTRKIGKKPPPPNFEGPRGFQGMKGMQGMKGTQGSVGIGLTGPQGFQGDIGSQGTIGTQGFQGNIGATGATGLQGIIGVTGPAGGPQGPPGELGPTGPLGGPIGPTGVQGFQGFQGDFGPIGATGIQGPTGATGPQGLQGQIGSGATGPQGFQGEVGNNGGTGAIQTLSFAINPDQSGVGTENFVTGLFETISSSRTTSVVTAFSMNGNNLFIRVNSITSGGAITITGTSVNINTGVPTTSTMEIITVDTTLTQYYKTVNNWIDISSINISGTTGLNYAYGRLNYINIGTRDFTITGYRVEARANGNNSDMTFLLQKIQDNGGKKFSIINLENIQINNATKTITDNVRTGANNRSLTSAVAIWPDNLTYTLNQTDFENYFTTENDINGSNNTDGLLTRVASTSLGGPGGPDYVRIVIRFYLR